MPRLYRRQDRDQIGARGGRANPVFQGLWVLGILALAIFAFVAGFRGFIDQMVPPFGTYKVDATARRTGWEFTYPNGHVADTLHVATDRPVELTLQSADVVHSLSIPAFRVHQAILPGKLSRAWFEATVPGAYPLASNIYSGEEFLSLRTEVVAHQGADFEAWLQEVSDIFKGRTMEEVGELLVNRNGCLACHSLDGSKLIGPSFKDMYGFEFDTVEGRRVIVDDAYVKESILEPNASVIAGFQPVMTPFAGLLDDREIEAITVWLKTQSSKGGVAAADPETNEGQEN